MLKRLGEKLHARGVRLRVVVARSSVRLQWDPDHDPAGKPLPRKAIQLGLRGSSLREYGEHPMAIEDVTDFVVRQRPHRSGDLALLTTPQEAPYVPGDVRAGQNVLLA